MDFDDTLNIGSGPGPTNGNPGSDGAVLECITDLVNCCSGTQQGNWYFPDGSRVGEFGSGTRFMVNRGLYEVINGQQFHRRRNRGGRGGSRPPTFREGGALPPQIQGLMTSQISQTYLFS